MSDCSQLEKQKQHKGMFTVILVHHMHGTGGTNEELF